MNGGGEFLFWSLLFGLVLAIAGIHEVVGLAFKLRDARREVARLTAELRRHQIWVHYRSPSPKRWRPQWMVTS